MCTRPVRHCTVQLKAFLLSDFVLGVVESVEGILLAIRYALLCAWEDVAHCCFQPYANARLFELPINEMEW